MAEQLRIDLGQWRVRFILAGTDREKLNKLLTEYYMACRVVTETPADLAPAQPAGLLADAQTTGIVLSWTPNTEVDLAGYEVYRATAEGGPYTKLTSGGLRTVSDYTDTTAVSGTQYWYRVTAVDFAGNESPYAVVTTIRPSVDATAPAVPTGLTANGIGINDVLVDWDANTDTDLAGYNIYRTTTSGMSYTKLNGGTLLVASQYRDTTTVAATTYYYAVTAVDTTGNESAKSAEVTWGVPATDTTPPADPTGLVLVPSVSGILLSWNANLESDFLNYEVDRSATGVGAWSTIASPTAATYNDTGATAGAVNYYRIRARDNDSNWSGYLTGNATRPTGSTPGGSFIPTFVGTYVPCVVHARLVNKTNYNPSTGETAIQSSEFPSFASQNPLLVQVNLRAIIHSSGVSTQHISTM
jgi:fibronectin type 3 domain-containing protein